MAISICLAPNMFLRHRESVVETGQMSSVETRQLSQQQSSVLSQQQNFVLSTEDISPVSAEDITAAGRRPAAVASSVPESSGFAWACGVLTVAPRRGLTRGEESEEGGSVSR